jgi:hypothetical protein
MLTNSSDTSNELQWCYPEVIKCKKGAVKYETKEIVLKVSRKDYFGRT